LQGTLIGKINPFGPNFRCLSGCLLQPETFHPVVFIGIEHARRQISERFAGYLSLTDIFKKDNKLMLGDACFLQYCVIGHLAH